MTAEQERAKKVFTVAYGKSSNFMTPTVLDYGMITQDVAYELSTGYFNHETLYGVTVLGCKYGKKIEKLKQFSCCLHSRAEADEYIKQLAKELSK